MPESIVEQSLSEYQSHMEDLKLNHDWKAISSSHLKWKTVFKKAEHILQTKAAILESFAYNTSIEDKMEAFEALVTVVVFTANERFKKRNPNITNRLSLKLQQLCKDLGKLEIVKKAQDCFDA